MALCGVRRGESTLLWSCGVLVYVILFHCVTLYKTCEIMVRCSGEVLNYFVLFSGSKL